MVDSVKMFPSILILASLFIDQILKSFLAKWSAKRALQSPIDEKSSERLMLFWLTTRQNVQIYS
jgi:hypothetical protein